MNVVHDTIADLLARGAAVRFQAHGNSMEPTIHSGEHLIVEPVQFSALERGDIVLSLTTRGLTAHRLIGIEPSTLITRGDNAPAPDAPIAPREL
ncbi:MAG TPA: S24/S26 family peptidase, partial [Thermoanaerobaculia bacterium]